MFTSRLTDLSYGDKSAPYLEPGKAFIRQLPYNQTTAEVNKGHLELSSGESVPVTAELAEKLHQGWLASRKSAISQLGFDPARLLRTPDNKETQGFSSAGLFDPTTDVMWQDARYDSTLIHESFHRGIEKLRQEGLIPKHLPKEELLVRALMQKHFGDIEKGRGDKGDIQVNAAKNLEPEYQKEFDQLEKNAAEYIARKHPGGPR